MFLQLLTMSFIGFRLVQITSSWHIKKTVEPFVSFIQRQEHLWRSLYRDVWSLNGLVMKLLFTQCPTSYQSCRYMIVFSPFKVVEDAVCLLFIHLSFWEFIVEMRLALVSFPLYKRLGLSMSACYYV